MVDVPKEPKVYTTVYDNFKGVDYTDDASNVFRRRSPDGLNMLPDLDGRPYKRTGWEISVPSSAFGTGAVQTDRLHHFNIGGTEYIMIFNNIGVFYMTSATGVVRCVYKDGEGNESPFPPAISAGTENLPADANRSFYFEGNGIAGFYTFVGNRLFRFDGHYYYDVDPHIPTILDSCSPGTGSGTVGEYVNMLTEKRTVSYLADGTQDYALPEAPKSNSVKVEVFEDGSWEEKTSGWELQQGSVVHFSTAPANPQTGVDNVRITYEPSNSGNVYSMETTVTDAVSLKSTYAKIRTRTKTVTTKTAVNNNSGFAPSTITKEGDWSAYSKKSESNTSATIKLPNNMSSDSTIIKSNESGSWTDNENFLSTTWAAAGDSVTVASTTKIATTYGTATTVDTGYYLIKEETTVGSKFKTVKKTYYRMQTVTYAKTFNVKVQYPKYTIVSQGASETNQSARDAFMACRKALNYGNNIYNQIFLSSCPITGFETRAWFCAKNDPSYWADLNYIEVGSEDTEIVGMSKVGNYVGFMKAASGTDSSVYFAYPTTFDNIETFAVRQGVNGIGAVAAGAFNILNGEPLFLSKDGVVGIEVSDEETDRKAYNRSWFINKKLKEEGDLESAFSYVHNGMYYLAINNHCYVLDGSQKNSWMNEKTNLQYECYYLENIPAQCFAGMDGDLYFSDHLGNICRFKNPDEEDAYVDEYDVSCYDQMRSVLNMSFEQLEAADFLWDVGGCDFVFDNHYSEFPADEATHQRLGVYSMDELPATIYYSPEVVSSRKYLLAATREEHSSTGGTYYTLKDFAIYSLENFQEGEDGEDWMYTVTLKKGVPIPARWSTIADDDGAVHFFKNLQKKGTVISLMPASNTGVDVYIKPDEKDRILVGTTDAGEHTLPFEFYAKKKIKKYKRLQIICENNRPGDSFGIDQIIKSYTMGNYSKNKG